MEREKINEERGEDKSCGGKGERKERKEKKGETAGTKERRG